METCTECGKLPDTPWLTEGGETDDNIWTTVGFCRECWSKTNAQHERDARAELIASDPETGWRHAY